MNNKFEKLKVSYITDINNFDNVVRVIKNS